MASTDSGIHTKPVAIAPAPDNASSIDYNSAANGNGNSTQPTMLYTCQTCAKRKIKCDKLTPTCSSCRKSKLECIYQAPQPRRRKRKLSGEVDERLAQYERILSQHGLLPLETETTPSSEEVLSLRWQAPDTSRTGRLLASQGKSRYIDSNLWRNLGDDEMERMSDDEEADQRGADVLTPDPLTGALLGSPQSLLPYHPDQAAAMMLWKTHIENVEPICKILHIPSTFEMVELVSQHPAMASKADECLLFAIYHFAVFSMTEEECAQHFGQSRATLRQRYHHATRQALVNAAFLKTTEMSILQALVLFLLACRYSYDPHTYWILTGVAVRISQRMGLHRDGEKLGLPPFEVQMRRRLFYQIIPLDGYASQVSGTGTGMMYDAWDTQQPLNIDDDQIWPGMSTPPEERKGATAMIFCLARSTVGRLFVRAGKWLHSSASDAPPPSNNDNTSKDLAAVEALIGEAENEVEQKYIRYCDLVNPLHILTLALARSATLAMRLRLRLPKVRAHTVTPAERREMLALAQKIMDTDIAACAHTSLRRYRWHVRFFFVWGSWDALIFVLTSLRHGRLSDDEPAPLFSREEIDAAWSRVEQLYANHPDLVESKQALHVAVGRLTLKAWEANPPSSSNSGGGGSPPIFIESLRSLRNVKIQNRGASNVESMPAATLDGGVDSVTTSDPSSASEANALFGSLSSGGDSGLDVTDDFDFATADWVFWDQLIEDYQAQGGQ